VLSETYPPCGPIIKLGSPTESFFLEFFNEDLWKRIPDAAEYEKITGSPFKGGMPLLWEYEKEGKTTFQYVRGRAGALLVTLNGNRASNVDYERVYVRPQLPEVKPHKVQPPKAQPPKVQPPKVQPPEVAPTRPYSRSSSLSTVGGVAVPKEYVR